MEQITNGCGGKGSRFKPPYHIMFEACCNIHDELYEEGGNEIDRKIADAYLYEYIKLDVSRLPLYKRLYFYIWAYIYYLGVRYGGAKYFTYKSFISSKKPMKIQNLKAVFFEAGHGGKNASGTIDNGAAANGTTERKHTVEIAKIATMFMTQVAEFKNVKVHLIGVDESLTLVQKVARINQICKRESYDASNSILVSIHVNSAGVPTASGVESRFYSGSDESFKLADWVSQCQSDLTGLKKRVTRGDRTNRHGRLAIVRDTNPLACLVECGFITCADDVGKLKSPDQEKLFGQGIVRGIKRFLGIMS